MFISLLNPRYICTHIRITVNSNLENSNLEREKGKGGREGGREGAKREKETVFVCVCECVFVCVKRRQALDFAPEPARGLTSQQPSKVHVGFFFFSFHFLSFLFMNFPLLNMISNFFPQIHIHFLF